MKRLLSLLALAAVVGACATPASTSIPADPAPTPRPSQPIPQGIAAALEPVDSCDVLLDYFVEQALERVGPWGLDGYRGWFGAVDTTAAAEAADGAGASGSSEPTSTNVQVEGVDEGDIVKADGDYLYVLSNGRLRVLSTAEGGVAEVGSLRLSEQWGMDQMLLHGDRLAVVSAGFDVVEPLADVARDIAPVGSNVTGLTLIDVSDKENPSVIRRVTMDGQSVGTRLVGSHLRLVLEAYPVGLQFTTPEGAGLRAERAATERNREIIRESTIENWLPYFVTDEDAEGTVMDCTDVLLPPEPSGLGTLSVLDFDLETGIDEWKTASVVASGATVYANADRTYVATQQWFDPAAFDSDDSFDGIVTRIHRFDTPVDGEPTYVASGDVEGFLLNQFAMDEFDGHLRVASTTAPSWWSGGSGDSESQVTVLATDGNRLSEVGSVGELGVTETIHAVRFMGPVGYVVTFRQTDPLYVIDLSDPADPAMTGELKIPGFSAYLHPVADGRLLGVGQDADPETGMTKGLQISLFDVSDPTDPTRLDTFSPKPVAEGEDFHVGSPVEWDHKAFTLADGTGFVPFEGWTWSERGGDSLVLGIVAVDWEVDSLAESKVLSLFDGKPGGNEWGMSVQRTVAKGDLLYAVGHNGVATIDLRSGEIVHQLSF